MRKNYLTDFSFQQHNPEKKKTSPSDQIDLRKSHWLSFLFLTLLFLISAKIDAQTTIISPAGDGGFETGTTLALNNWTATTGGAAANRWVSSTGATAGFSGTRCAYVTQNSAGLPPAFTYDIGTTRATHFYRNITVPAGESNITLSFNWIGRGESTYDRMKIWIVPTTVTPIYGTAISASGTAPTGNIQIGATEYSLQGTWTTTSFTLPAAYAGTTVRLIFEWTNDNSLGTQPPSAIDNISLTSSPPCANPTLITATITSQTTTTVNWTAASPAPGLGYQYYLSTSSTAPTAGTTPTGSTGAGVTTVNLTGLTIGATYYVWVRSNCNAGSQSTWTGPTSFFQPTCMPGGGTGTSTLGCPSVLSGGLGLNGADPATITCISASSCVDLEANYLALGQTTNYTVESIPYAPPYQFGCLQNPVSVNVDDVWSPVINLPFNFCYYGNSYNSCVIGSNGSLTFDTSHASTASGYSFSNSLPSTTGALFANTIYGVYHDIDPSIGGEVGWELITLNSGCRALVASWSDVPMFSNNSLLYTGMMVLYENTNIIEVYIKEKRIDGTWNSGNAIVGVQNATGTQAVVAPGRNGLDADWTVTNEAWRFVPSGTSITSLKWYQGAGTGGPVVGTTDVINVCPAVTTIYTAEITYSLCNGSTLIETEQTTVTVNINKVWNGSVNTDWNNGNNWTPLGVPTSTDCVIIPNVTNDPIIPAAGYNAFARTLTIYNGGLLTLSTPSNITVTNVIDVNPGGTFNINNSASILQVNPVTNIGDINMNRTANTIDRLDYVYWSSPVATFNSSAISPGSLTNLIWKWAPTITGNGTGNYGNWLNGNENMVRGKGYIVRGPNSYGTPANYTATFTGVPNNGNITIPISRGTYDLAATYSSASSPTYATKDDDNWNLVGNPYPSAISAYQFLDVNTNIEGFVKLWTHGNNPNQAILDPFYNNYEYNYTATDYVTYNKTGSSAGGGTDYMIGAGQGFFVLMKHTSALTTENIVFNNTMRNSTYINSNFYRDGNTNSSEDKGRIWLDLVGTNSTMRTLVGYINGATDEKDRTYDAITDLKVDMNIYSLIGYEGQIIQGRKLPFNENDQVPLGIKISQNGNYSIGIGTVDGFFNDTNYNIFLEDKTLNVIHNLRTSPYSFTATSGIWNDRFVLRYRETTLSNDEFDYANEVKIFANSNINISSVNQSIKEVIVYDILGKTLVDKKNVNKNEVVLTDIIPTNNMLIVKVILDNDAEVIKKVIY